MIDRNKFLMEFAGILSEESADKIEKSIKESRRKRNSEREKRIKTILPESLV